MEADEFKSRKAPYAPVSALREFFSKIRNVGVPARVDQRFLQKHNIAAGNEWSLLSALKFLGVIDRQGEPTAAYRRLLSSDQFEGTLRNLVELAYGPLFEDGGGTMTADELTNYFRVTSSPSQARNAARFFLAVSGMAGMLPSSPRSLRTPVPAAIEREKAEATSPPASPGVVSSPSTRDAVLRAKATLLEKLPAPHPAWTAAEYSAICDRFLEMLRHLDG